MNYLDIELQSSNNKSYSLRSFKGKKIILYFYPKDNTSGCIIEAKDFTLFIDDFKDKDYFIIGVSRDSVKSHQNFIKKHNLKILLLSDTDEQLVKAFNVLKEKTLYGKKYIGIIRSTFILDEEGKIIKEYRKVIPKTHVKILLSEL